MWTPVYFVRYITFPARVDGVTIPNDDGTFDIYINQNLCPEKQIATLQHELAHIKADHFYDDIDPVDQIEAQADCWGVNTDYSMELYPPALA